MFWTKHEEEERIDGNLGVIYRAIMADGVIDGAPLFYNHDFQIGHSRLDVGIDAQKGGFYGAFNYSHPLSNTEDEREGYVEDALQGMNAIPVIESDVTRFNGPFGSLKGWQKVL
ncbi:MAG: inverse autotransporter beta domain-containing protein [Hyphomicrobiales bacterium]|nr:inverse autotransporter beta domain-containing protein [Hyphomicrobiales bacterium]